MRRQLLSWAMCAASVLGMATAPMVAQTHPAAAHATSKPAPAPPPDAWEPAAGPRMTPKPHRTPGAMPRALAAWTVSIGASPTYLWPRQYATITATTNQELGPTPYYLIIGQLVGRTRESPGINSYNAYVGTYSTTVPPPNVQAAAPGNGYWTYDVNWHGIGLGIASDVTTPIVGQEITLTATTGEDVGPSPFWIQIYDLTSGTRFAVCGYGTSCTARVTAGLVRGREAATLLSGQRSIIVEGRVSGGLSHDRYSRRC